jgi:hypothetical protein
MTVWVSFLAMALVPGLRGESALSDCQRVAIQIVDRDPISRDRTDRTT